MMVALLWPAPQDEKSRCPFLLKFCSEGCRLSSVAPQKTCPYCREEIHDEARKCPHCNQWLGKAMAMVYVPLIILFGFAAYLLIWPLSLFGGGADPATLLSEIVVVDSSFRLNTQGDYTYVSAVGTIRNDSEDITADDVYIEVQYFDGEGTLIDTEGGEQYGLTLLPGSEVAFRLQARASSPESEYATHKVFVRSVRDARDRF